MKSIKIFIACAFFVPRHFKVQQISNFLTFHFAEKIQTSKPKIYQNFGTMLDKVL